MSYRDYNKAATETGHTVYLLRQAKLTEHVLIQDVGHPGGPTHPE